MHYIEEFKGKYGKEIDDMIEAVLNKMESLKTIDETIDELEKSTNNNMLKPEGLTSKLNLYNDFYYLDKEIRNDCMVIENKVYPYL